MLRRVATLVLLVTLATARAEAQPSSCAGELMDWAARCADTHDVAVRVTACPSDELAVLSASVAGGPALRVELARGRRGFRAVGAYGLSPIGEFPDWARAPAPLRDAFERTSACAAALPARPLRGGDVPVAPSLPGTSGPRAPWLLALALAAAAWGARKIPRESLRRNAIGIIAGGAATLALRALRHPPAYFHQNGQGPLWVEHLFSGGHHPYGPGFAEVFGLLARRAPEAPEAVVFATQSALAATQPAAAWWIARSVGAGPWVAGALALATALDPVLGRAARSEAYFATGTSLMLLAAVAVVRARSLWGPLVAGLLLAQAVRVHPALWVPAALVPIAALLREGPPRDRALACARALAATGAVVALTSAPALLAVLRSDLAAHWMSAQSRGSSSTPTDLRLAAVALAAVALAAVTPARWRAALPVALLVGAAAVLRATDNYTRSGSPPWVVAAYALCFAPLALACVASLAAALPDDRRVARAGGLVLAVALVALTHRRLADLTRMPTDVLELRRAWAWRATLPRGAKVFFVGRAGNYVLTLPIHGGAGRALRAVALDLGEPPPDLRAFGPDTYYYRASTCASPPGAAWCDAFERAQRLRPVGTWDLPAVPSMRHLTYVTPRVHTGLFRVTE